MADLPNLVILVLDTVRARNLSHYGHERKTTPFIDHFAEQNISFEKAYAPAEWTPTSHASVFTGTYPWVHQTGRSFKRLHPELETLSEVLSKEGYDTVGFSNNIHLSPDFDFSRGFDIFEFNTRAFGEPFQGGAPIQELRRNSKGSGFNQIHGALRYVHETDKRLLPTIGNWVNKKLEDRGLFRRNDSGAKRANKFVDRWLHEQSDDNPFFLFVNFMEGHTPYQAPEEHLERFNPVSDRRGFEDLTSFYERTIENQSAELSSLLDRYDGSISYLDDRVRQLVTAIDDATSRETMLVITSDHGEAFGEHGLYGHATGVYNEIVRVPLLVRTPERKQAKVTEPVSIQWIMPTFLEMIGRSIPEYCVNASLFTNNRPVVGETKELDLSVKLPENADKFTHKARFCVADGLKYITTVDGAYEELYHVNDYYEKSDIADGNPDDLQTSRALLTEVVERSDTPPRRDNPADAMDADTRAQLRQLGYLE